MIDQEDRIIKINIEDEMKSSYIDYSMSVIVSRALPDVRDGFKPVHRRILFGMSDQGNTPDKPHKKSARIVGEVLGKYHPHGDSSVYNAMVRLAQVWSMRYTLVDGQGNMGSVDGDSPAAMRYTEARLNRLAEEMLRDIDKETVDFQLNFDDTLQEPSVLPTRIPNLLINGSSGIAVGMATNIAPHNLTECINGIIAYIDDREIDTRGLMEYIKAPDFPTGSFIYGYKGVEEAFETGRGRIVMRGRAEIESGKTHDKIIITEIPYLVNKADMIKHIADLVSDKKIEGISNINDESDRDGMRIVVDIKRDGNANVVLNKLYKLTALQSSFSVNNIALVKGRPELLTLKRMIELFVEHRIDVVIRRTRYELRKAEEEAGEALRRRQSLERRLRDLQHRGDDLLRLIGEEVAGTPCYIAQVSNKYGGGGANQQAQHAFIDSGWARPQTVEVWARTMPVARAEIERRYPPAFGYVVLRIQEAPQGFPVTTGGAGAGLGDSGPDGALPLAKAS